MKYRDLIKMVEAAGWVEVRQTASHILYRKPGQARPLVVAGGGKMNRDVPTGTANAILRQAGLKGD